MNVLAEWMWLIWTIFAVIFIVGEIFTAGFFLLWFGIGAAVAAFLAFLGLGAGYQLGAFVLVSGALLPLSRKFAERVSGKQPSGVGADRFIGETGVVIEKIDPHKDSGLVRVEKNQWRAESVNGEVIPKDERVKVVKLKGSHLIVEPLNEKEA